MNEIQEWFKAGTAVLQTGNKTEAETLLLRVVEADENHEQGWLWLSRAVQTDDDRRVCLENVLTINPDNVIAQRELTAMVGEKTAVFSPTTTFDDIWSRDDEICAYCAHEIDIDDRKCPHCGHNLIIKHFRYEEVSSNLHIFWVLLLGTGQLFMIQALLRILQGEVGLAIIVNFVLMGVYIIFAIAVYYRQSWAHYGVIYLTGSLLAVALLNHLIFSTLSFVPDVQLADGEIFFITIAATGFQKVFYIALLGALGNTLVYALLFVSSDFVQDKKRHTAVLQSGINAADRYDNVARKQAKEGRWATAVLHWQRAAAKAPHTTIYQRRLADGYARLGYYKRSLSVLNGAIATSNSPEMKEKLEKMKTAVTKAISA